MVVVLRKGNEITWEQHHSRLHPHAATWMAWCRGFGFSLDPTNQTSKVPSYGELEGIYLISQLIGTQDAFDDLQEEFSETHGRFEWLQDAIDIIYYIIFF